MPGRPQGGEHSPANAGQANNQAGHAGARRGQARLVPTAAWCGRHHIIVFGHRLHM